MGGVRRRECKSGLFRHSQTGRLCAFLRASLDPRAPRRWRLPPASAQHRSGAADHAAEDRSRNAVIGRGSRAARRGRVSPIAVYPLRAQRASAMDRRATRSATSSSARPETLAFLAERCEGNLSLLVRRSKSWV
jgi:hypothetical protein